MERLWEAVKSYQTNFTFSVIFRHFGILQLAIRHWNVDPKPVQKSSLKNRHARDVTQKTSPYNFLHDFMNSWLLTSSGGGGRICPKEVCSKIYEAQSRDQCYKHYFRSFSPFFFAKIGDFLQRQIYGEIFFKGKYMVRSSSLKNFCVLSQNRQSFKFYNTDPR
jgi:hypothetical protein